jgi:hypothetical protein
MIQPIAWKTHRTREGGYVDRGFSVSLYNERDTQIVPPWVLTEDQAVLLFGPQILEWPDEVKIPVSLAMVRLP